MQRSLSQAQLLLHTLAGVCPPELWRAAHDAYSSPKSSPPRVYHTFDHVVAVAREYQRVGIEIGWHQPVEVSLAVLYHDAVYVVGAKNNEEASAALARDHIGRWLNDIDVDVCRVESLIELTARHGSLDSTQIDGEAALFLDCDMAILGAAPADYDVYAERVAAEYSALVTAHDYRRGRVQFLETLLAASRLFLSDFFQQRLGTAARENLQRELASTC